MLSNLRRITIYGFTFLVGALILCSPALLNGYPIIFSDLLDYGVDGMNIVRRVWPVGNHPPFYGVAIEIVDFERTLWPVVLLQGLIVAHLLYVVLRSFEIIPKTRSFLGLLLGLTLLSSLPWYVSVVMPDVFEGIAVLSFYLLMFRTNQIGVFEKIYLFGLSVVSLLFHVSFFVVTAGLFAVACCYALLCRHRQLYRPHLGIAALVLLAAASISALVSVKFWGNVNGPPNSPPYLLADILINGPGKEFLAKECGSEHFVLCDYQDNIPDDVEEFMFRSYSPYFSSWQTKRIKDESMAIVIGTLQMFPLQTMIDLLKNGIIQIVTFNTEVAQLEDLSNGQGYSLGTEFAIRMPFVTAGYDNSWQAADRLNLTFLRRINGVDVVVVFFSAFTMICEIVICVRRRDWISIEFLTTIMIALALNGIISGAAVGVFGRFGARLIWLLPFSVVAIGLSIMRTAGQKTAHSDVLTTALLRQQG